MIAAGRLNHRVTIKQPATSPTQNAFGEITSALTTLASVWAEITPLTTRELEVAKGYAATVNTKLTIRYRTDLKSTHRIIEDDRQWNVNGFYDPTGDREDLVIYATEVL